MKVIRDEETCGLAMIPLFHQWGIKRCNVKGCTNKPTTIIAQLAPNVPVSGWCEDHYQEFKESGRFEGTLVFDNYDAFAAGGGLTSHSPDRCTAGNDNRRRECYE